MFVSRPALFLFALLASAANRVAVDAAPPKKKKTTKNKGPVSSRVVTKDYRVVQSGKPTVVFAASIVTDGSPPEAACDGLDEPALRKLSALGGWAQSFSPEVGRRLQGGPPGGPPIVPSIIGTRFFLNGNVYDPADVTVSDGEIVGSVPEPDPDAYFTLGCTVLDGDFSFSCDEGQKITVTKQECTETLCVGKDQFGNPNCVYSLFSGDLPFEITLETEDDISAYVSAISGGSGDFFGATGNAFITSFGGPGTPEGEEDPPGLFDIRIKYIEAKLSAQENLELKTR